MKQRRFSTTPVVAFVCLVLSFPSALAFVCCLAWLLAGIDHHTLGLLQLAGSIVLGLLTALFTLTWSEAVDAYTE